MDKLTLIRSYLPDRTIGKLSNNLRTLERPWLYNATDISCIPEGTYTVVPDDTGRFQYYRVLDVDGRTAIEFHGGVGPLNSNGCVLVGMQFNKQLNLMRSMEALKHLQAQYPNGFELTIRRFDPDKDEW